MCANAGKLDHLSLAFSQSHYPPSTKLNLETKINIKPRGSTLQQNPPMELLSFYFDLFNLLDGKLD